MSRKWCDCEGNPYRSGPDWDLNVSSDRNFCRACGLDVREEVVWAVRARATDAVFIRTPSRWLWVVAETAPARERLLAFRPEPTFLRSRRTQLTAGWCLEQDLDGAWTDRLNRRLAGHIGASSRFVQVPPGREMPTADDPDTEWRGRVHSARAVAGRLRDRSLRRTQFAAA